jgi:iron complex outermembrane receptor protein
MKRYKWLLTLLTFVSLACVSSALAATEEPTKVEETQDYIKEFEEMFKSPYQEEDYYRADRLLITATGSLVPVHKAPSVASIITKEDIEKIGAISLDEILETVPGIHTLPSGLNIFSSIWSIRGIHTSINPHVLLLIDGIPLTRNYDGGRPHTFRMPVSMISRVEVIRGPGSAVYGADAFAGVINVITKDNFDINGTEFGGRYGSFDSYGVWLQHGKQYGGWDFWFGYEVESSRGDKNRVVDQDFVHNHTNPFLPPADPALSHAPGYIDTRFHNTQTHLGLRKDNFSLRLYGHWSNDNAMGPSAQQIVDYENKVNTTSFLADIEYRDSEFRPDWDVGVRLHYAYLDGDNYFQLFPKAFLNMIGRPIATDQYYGLETTAFYRGFNRHQFRLSAGLKHFSLDTEQYDNFSPSATNPFTDTLTYIGSDSPDIYCKPQNRDLWFLSLQDEWEMGRKWSFTGGIRFDEYSDFGSTINPRAALVWETRYDLTTKLMYGRAFRTPAFAEQYVQNNPQITGNPDLEPETIDTYELAFDYQPTMNLRTILSFFTYKADKLIEYVGSLPAPAENYGEQEGNGFEIELDWKVKDNLRIRSNFAYQRSENKKNDAIVHDAPEKQFYLNPHWNFLADWSLDGQYYWIAGRHREKGDPRPDIKDYDLVNLTLRRKNIAKHWGFALAIRNVFDENVREPSPYDSAAPAGAHIPNDYPMEGRSIYGEGRYVF